MSSLNKVLNKPQVPEDDYDRYGKILANKLRKLSELESQTIMYEIDGIFIRRLYAPTSNGRPSTSCSSYSGPTSIQVPHPSPSPSSTLTSYSEPIGQVQLHTSSHHYSSTVDSEPHPNVIIISDETLNSGVISQPNNENDVLSQAYYEA